MFEIEKQVEGIIPPEPTYKKNGVAHMGELLEADRLALN
jgi:hypothetical protein